MKIKKEYIETMIVGYKCDICSESISDNCLRLIDFTGNTKSGNFRECDLCQTCFEYLEKFIVDTLGGVLNEV